MFILGKDNINDLKAFLDTKWHEWPDEKVEKYYFENWIKDFIN